MNVTDPIADMLTRIRNALMAKHKEVEIPGSNMKIEIAKILKKEGYIRDYEFIEDGKQGVIRILFKEVPVIQGLKRISKPGRRVYVKAKDIPRVKGGLGICILSTPVGVLTGTEAKKRNIGGEVLAYIW
ncbi:MAG TPA: 30S ribosomal protein S8 [bacterium (Candidatus Stahlbacteria)]|nr:30S ribosomal protein S8 [Candidatus Stahlbacteria bacterium]